MPDIAPQILPPSDLYSSYQNWMNTLNPETAPQAIYDPSKVYATPSDFDRARAGGLPPEYSADDLRRIQGNEDDRYIEMGINPFAARKARIDAEEAAIRMQGQREAQQLIAGGATPEEAFRRTIFKINYNHPERTAQGLHLVSSPGIVPNSIQATPVKDAAGNIIGQTIVPPAGVKIHASQFTPPAKTPPDVLATQKNTQGEIELAQRELTQARKDISAALDDKEKQEAARRALGARQRLTDLENQSVVYSTNWMTPKISAPSQATTSNVPFKEGEIVEDKSGKRYRIENGQPVPLKR
jgi:hypothetical protein